MHAHEGKVVEVVQPTPTNNSNEDCNSIEHTSGSGHQSLLSSSSLAQMLEAMHRKSSPCSDPVPAIFFGNRVKASIEVEICFMPESKSKSQAES